MNCENCHAELKPARTREKIGGKKYCDNKCQHEFQSRKRRSDFRNGAYVGTLIGFPANGWTRALLIEEFGYNCASCGIGGEYNGKPLLLEVNHIDGDALNNSLQNLEFLCPNCHSQTPTYRARNKKSARTFRNKRTLV